MCVHARRAINSSNWKILQIDTLTSLSHSLLNLPLTTIEINRKSTVNKPSR